MKEIRLEFKCPVCKKQHLTPLAKRSCLASHPLQNHAERKARVLSHPETAALYRKFLREDESESLAIPRVERTGLYKLHFSKRYVKRKKP